MLMRIEFEIGYLDHLRYQVIHAFMQPVANGFFLILAGLIFSSELSDNSVTGSLAVAGGFYLLMWIVQTVFVALYILKFGQDGFLTRHVIEIREDALFEANRFVELLREKVRGDDNT